MNKNNLLYYNISILITLWIFFFFSILTLGFIPDKTLLSPLKEINKVIALTGFVIVGLSFAISGITYFTNFIDKSLLIRKNLGIVGFWVILLHGLISLFLLPEFFSVNYYLNNLFSFIAALTSLILLIVMAVISNNFMMKMIRPKTWRLILRYGGYSAYILALLHFGQKNFTNWINWINSLGGNSTNFGIQLAFYVFVFGITVLLLRFALFLRLFFKAKN